MPRFFKADTHEPFEYMKSSTVLDSDALITNEKCIFNGFLLVTDGTNDVTIDVLDEEGGDKVIPTITVKGSDNLLAMDVSPGLKADGLYINITTSGTCKYQIYYND